MTPKVDKVLNIQSRELVREIDFHFPPDAEIELCYEAWDNPIEISKQSIFFLTFSKSFHEQVRDIREIDRNPHVSTLTKVFDETQK